jgi:hypothetical protein
MPGLADAIKRHPIVTFFVLIYVITGSLVPFRSFGAFGPLIAAVITAPLVRGRPGSKTLAANNPVRDVAGDRLDPQAGRLLRRAVTSRRLRHPLSKRRDWERPSVATRHLAALSISPCQFPHSQLLRGTRAGWSAPI